jgi:polyisoprenoid-binding protein YceI
MLYLSRDPAIELTIEAASLDTNNPQRDKHLRSADFFDVENHPLVRFVSDSATLDNERLKARGRLYAAGESITLEIDAELIRVGDELEIDATTFVDHRQLGMTLEPTRDGAHPEQADRARPPRPRRGVTTDPRSRRSGAASEITAL